MTTYTATIRSEFVFATEEIEADTPEQALERAREFAASNVAALDWQSYCPTSVIPEEIEISGPEDGDGPIWRSADLALRLAAQDLFDALERLVERERTEAADSGFSDDEMTWLEDARRALAKAKG